LQLRNYVKAGHGLKFYGLADCMIPLP
jgi:hypothetical protein